MGKKMSDTYTWAQMLDDFRALGGVADNVEQRQGRYGNGLFPIDPDKPVRIVVPDALLFDSDLLVLDGNDLVVSPSASVSDDVRAFIARYQKHYSWGADGKKSVESFEEALKTLPEAVLQRLQRFRLLNLAVRQKGEWAEVLRRRFLQSRCIYYHERRVLMPIIELINHSPRSPGYMIGTGIQFRGKFADEVTVNYSRTSDALMRFFSYGFTSAEPVAFSLPMSLKLNNGKTLQIGYDTNKAATGEKTAGAEKAPLPAVSTEGNHWRISHLRIGLEHTPRVPRTLLRKALADWPEQDVDEVFERVRSVNMLALTDLLGLADGLDSDIGRDLRAAVRHQLRSIAQCYGVRT